MTGFIAAKVRNGPRFAEIDAAVEHVAGATEPPPLKPRPKRTAPGLTSAEATAAIAAAASPPAIKDHTDFIHRYKAYMIERDAALDAMAALPPDQRPAAPGEAAAEPPANRAKRQRKPRDPVAVTTASEALAVSSEQQTLIAEPAPAVAPAAEPQTVAEPAAAAGADSFGTGPDFILADVEQTGAARGDDAPAGDAASSDAAADDEAEPAADDTATGQRQQHYSSAGNGGAPGGNGGSKSGAARNSYAEDHADEPFADSALLLQGYQFARAFDYTLPDGAVLYEQRRYELRADIPALKKRPRKRFLVRRQVNGAWVFGAGPRQVLFNWRAIMRAGPGSTIFVAEGESNAVALIKAGLLATTVLSHKWAPECVAALSGCHAIILADHDKDGEKLAADAQRKLAPVAASSRIVPALHLWKHCLATKSRNQAATSKTGSRSAGIPPSCSTSAAKFRPTARSISPTRH